MKKFNLCEFKKNTSRKVVTRDGRPVRILFTDAKGYYPIVGLIDYDDKRDYPESYTENGSCYIDNKESSRDLFFEPIKKDGWINLFRKVEGIIGGYLQDTEEDAMKEIRDKSCHVATIHIEWEE